MAAAPVPAFRRGSSRMRYSATSRKTPSDTQPPQTGATKKCSCRMLDTACACISTADMAGETGVTKKLPTPAAVAPISTILPRYFSAGILPL